jgi:uncharacterized protein
MVDVLAIVAADSKLADLADAVRARLDDDPGHDFHHALRVASWTLRIDSSIDERHAIAAALLHDVVNVPKDSPARTRASELSAGVARELLPRYGFDSEAIELIAGAIRDHSYSRGSRPESRLGKALQDADRLEALGALGLMRCVSCGTRMGARYFDAEDPFAERRALDDLRFSVDHFFTKLVGLPKTMTTEVGRREAERRVGFLRVFLEQLAIEIGVPVPPDR